MQNSSATNGRQPNQHGNDEQFIQGQYSRLGYFLLGSSFLVAAFITLVTSEKYICVLLTHTVAALGSVIAALYAFMNFWDWAIEPRRMRLLHAWFTPFAFFVFWIAAWWIVVESSLVLLVILLFPLFCLFQWLRRKWGQWVHDMIHRIVHRIEN